MRFCVTMRSVYLDLYHLKYTKHTHTHIWTLVTGWRWKFFFHLGLSPPRDAHTHAKMMSAPENGSLFTSEWIQHFANKIYYKFIVLNAAEEFCMEIIFRKPHTIYRWLWCAVVNTHAGWTWQLYAFLNLRYLRHWVCSAAPERLRCRCFIAVLFIAIHFITFHIVSS